ncbi:PrpR N-terminal domain-containing protein [Metabacillus herbersteinensis]|uniref:PrpR N-terminal domain-containing protein n=1 Tax=Metabacillus herbersteinensis TaxID=283816 RepID=A0ABV6GF56_9BACI
MAIKTLFIAPYPAMTHLIEECRLEEHELEIDIKVGNLQDAIPLAKSGEIQGYDAIISRGGTAKHIEAEVGIPVIDVHVSGYDMLRVLTLANDFPGKKAIVGFSNITLGAKSITNLLDIEVEVYTVEKAEEVDSLVKQLKLEEYELIMGDVVTIDAATKHNLESILIQSGREAIFEAFQKVKSVHRLHKKKLWEVTFLNALLEDLASDFIVFNDEGEVMYKNWKTFDSCPISIDQLKATIQLGQLALEVTVLVDARQRKVKQSVVEKIIDNKTYYLIHYSVLGDGIQQQELQVESIAQLPMLIMQSETMSKCVTSIENRIKCNLWTLLGEEGTGKKIIANYIHYKKHQGNGLFASVTAKSALKMIDTIDPDIRTIYLNELERLSQEEKIQLKSLIIEWIKEKVNIIIAIRQEDTSFQSIIFHDENVRVSIPALRERLEDIKPLTTYFIASFHGELGTSAIKIKDNAMKLLEQHSWPGNVAELKTLLKDAVLEEKEYVIGKELISGLLGEKQKETSSHTGEFLNGTLDEIEKRIIDAIMLEENDNQTRVAERLGINRSTLWRKLKQ